MTAFRVRHIGPDAAERDAMLEIIGAASLDALAAEAIPGAIRLKASLDLPPGQSEDRYLRDLRDIAGRRRHAQRDLPEIHNCHYFNSPSSSSALAVILAAASTSR